MGVKASIAGNILISDSITGSVSLQKPIANSYSGTVQSYGQQVIIGTTSVTINLPIDPVEFVYIKNLSATAGTTVTTTWTPNGGSSATVITLDPGAYIIFCEATTTNGSSAISVISSASGTPIEYILVG